jgi:alkylation response protein AidB-like acyl-CoA dehydrogenase
MDFATPDALRPILQRMREVTDALEPFESRLHEGFYTLAAELADHRSQLRADGLWLPQLSTEHGGMGLSVLEHALVSEVLGRSPLGHYVLGCQAPDAGNMEILAEFGTPAQRERFLVPMVRGEIRSAFGMTEPEHAGSNPVWLHTRATRDGDSWVLDGHKWFTSGADGAAFVIVMAVTDPEAGPYERASMIIVPTATPGYELVRNIPVMGDRGEGWMSHGEVRLSGCRVPGECLLGQRGRGFAIAQARLGPGRIHHCMRWMGVCNRVFELMARRAATRELAPGELLGTRQTIQNWIAEARAEIDATRLLVLHAAWKIDSVGMKAAREDISLIKFHASGVMMRIVDRAIQVYGAAGMTDDLLLSWVYRHERGARIYDGPDEVHKSVVAGRILERFGMTRGERR